MSSAIPFVRPELALQWLAQRQVVTKDVFNPMMRDNAWTVAYISSVEQIERILASLRTAITSGQSIAEWRDSLSDTQLKAPHLNTVYRNAVFGALNEGRYARFLEDADKYNWLLYEAVDDSKVRPNHWANDGLAMEMFDARWEGRTPQLGHNCRCILLNFTREQALARSKRLDPAPDSLADNSGWGHAYFTPDRRPPSLREQLPQELTPPERFMTATLDVHAKMDTRALYEDSNGRVRTGGSGIVAGEAEHLLSLSMLDRKALDFYTSNDGGRMLTSIRASLLRGAALTPLQNTYLVTLRDAVLHGSKTFPELRSVERPVGSSRDPAAYLMPAYLTRSVKAHKGSAFDDALTKAKTGDVLHYSGPVSFNANGAQFGGARNFEIIVVNNTEITPVSRISSNFRTGIEEEALLWSPYFRVVSREQRGGYERIYVERIRATTADYELAESNLSPMTFGGLVLGKYRSPAIDLYIDAVMLNAA